VHSQLFSPTLLQLSALFHKSTLRWLRTAVWNHSQPGLCPSYVVLKFNRSFGNSNSPYLQARHFTRAWSAVNWNIQGKNGSCYMQGCTNFPRISEPLQYSRRQKTALMKVPYWEPTKIWRHRLQNSRHGDLDPGFVYPRCAVADTDWMFILTLWHRNFLLNLSTLCI